MIRIKTLSVWVCLLAGSSVFAEEGNQVFRGFTDEYYRRFYAQTEAEAIVPGAELSEADERKLRARIRRTSTEWAEALTEELELRGDGTFVFTFVDVSGVPKGVAYIDAVPVGQRIVQRGKWHREGQELRLRICETDNRLLDQPGELTMHYEGDEIVTGKWREDFGPSILRPVRPESVRGSVYVALADRIRNVRSQVLELGVAIDSLAEEVRAVSVASGANMEVASRAERIGELRRRVKAGDQEAALVAVVMLGSLEAREATPDLIWLLEQRQRGDLPVAASVVLGNWRAVDAVPALIEAIDEQDPVLTSTARSSLERITGYSVPSEGRSAGEVRDRWVEWWRENEAITRKRLEGGR